MYVCMYVCRACHVCNVCNVWHVRTYAMDVILCMYAMYVMSARYVMFVCMHVGMYVGMFYVCRDFFSFACMYAYCRLVMTSTLTLCLPCEGDTARG